MVRIKKIHDNIIETLLMWTTCAKCVQSYQVDATIVLIFLILPMFVVMNVLKVQLFNV